MRHSPKGLSKKQTWDVRTVGVACSVLDFSGEPSEMELTEKTDSMDLFPKLETFPDWLSSSDSLSESCVMSSWESDAVWFSSCTSSMSLTTMQSVLGAQSTSMGFAVDKVWFWIGCLSFVEGQEDAGAGATGHFTGDNVLSSVRSTTTFSSAATGHRRLRKPSRGPRPLTKGGRLHNGRGEASSSLCLSDGWGQACAQGRLSGWFSFSSEFTRLKGRRAAGRI